MYSLPLRFSSGSQISIFFKLNFELIFVKLGYFMRKCILHARTNFFFFLFKNFKTFLRVRKNPFLQLWKKVISFEKKIAYAGTRHWRENILRGGRINSVSVCVCVYRLVNFLWQLMWQNRASASHGMFNDNGNLSILSFAKEILEKWHFTDADLLCKTQE